MEKLDDQSEDETVQTEQNTELESTEQTTPTEPDVTTPELHNIPPSDEFRQVPAANPPAKSGLGQKLKSWRVAYVSHKKIAIPATVLLFLLLILAVPTSRYPALGLFIKKNFTIVVADSKTTKPISSVELTLDGKTVKTDQAGVATFSKVPVGKYDLKATKKYYKDTNTSVFVSLGEQKGSEILKLDPTGRQVKVKVNNKITGTGLKNAQVSAAGTDIKTDDKGEATIVLPPEQDTQDTTVTADGYNKLTSKLKVTEADEVAKENILSLTPSGKVYFLSKRTGKINVMKSDLDGANAQVVLEATGSEDDGDTILLASQDWKYLALKSKRGGAGKPASLYLIDTANGDKLTTMDEGDATFTLTGWSGHTFVYQVQRDKVQLWQGNRQSIKSFNADNAKLTSLDSTAGEGSGVASYNGTDYRSEYFGSVILVGNIVTYTKTWISGIYTPNGSSLAGKQNGIYTVGVDGQNKKLAKGFDATTTTSLEGKLYEPNEVYYRTYAINKTSYYELENGVISDKGDLASAFDKFYPTYLFSPSNNQTFWAEPRDGKNTLFIGDKQGDSSKVIGELSEYLAYGWFTDDYLLLSKNSSELYIVGTAGIGGDKPLIKVTDYHKPNTTFFGYGGGYGGL